MARRRLEERPLLSNHPLAWQLAMLLWAFGGLLFVALAFDATAEAIQRFDDRVWQLAVDLENGFAVGVAKVFDFLGSAWIVTPVVLLVAFYLAVRRRWERFWFWLLAMISSQLLIGPMKALYARPRPPLPLVKTTGFSFPSGHAVAGAAVAVALVIVLVPAGPRRRNLEIIAVAFTLVMGLSRVYLRAHWFTDVAAGASLGVGVSIGAALLVHYVDARRSASDPNIE